jgi:uncharacterized protein (TIGR04255 family)
MSEKPRLRDLNPLPRVVYADNPLFEVIAAIRFPPVLTLLQEYPADFQRRLGSTYPLADVNELTSPFSPGGRVEEPSPRAPTILRQFRFLSHDRSWMISLESTLLALTCTNYKSWDDFAPRFNEVLELAFELYEPKIAFSIHLNIGNRLIGRGFQ